MPGRASHHAPQTQPGGLHGGHRSGAARAASRGGAAWRDAQEHERALGAWQAELAEWPLLVMSTHGRARALAQALPGLMVDAGRMRANLDAMPATLPKGSANGWFDPVLARQAGDLALARVSMLEALAGGATPDQWVALQA